MTSLLSVLSHLFLYIKTETEEKFGNCAMGDWGGGDAFAKQNMIRCDLAQI